ncbi:MAG: homocysteine S-methyltransferase family protein, partial [Candidatus Latescibacterota bacterium]
YTAEGRTVLASIYRGYLDIGKESGHPMIVLAPTWRASPTRLAAAGLGSVERVNRDCVEFLSSIRDEYRDFVGSVFVGGLMGCAGNAYRPEEALSAEEAETFHRPQAEALARSGVDFLMASTIPAATEAIGIARAMSGAGCPYVVSYIVRGNGTLLDGTPLAQTIGTIDSEVTPKPFFYMVNCVHPLVYEQAISQPDTDSVTVRERVLGLQANASWKSPEELEGLEYLDSEEPEAFAESMVRVHDRLGTKVLGGCCGTDHRHIRCIAELLERK